MPQHGNLTKPLQLGTIWRLSALAARVFFFATVLRIFGTVCETRVIFVSSFSLSGGMHVINWLHSTYSHTQTHSRHSFRSNILNGIRCARVFTPTTRALTYSVAFSAGYGCMYIYYCIYRDTTRTRALVTYVICLRRCT